VHVLNITRTRTRSQCGDFSSDTERQKRRDWEKCSNVFTDNNIMKEGTIVTKSTTNMSSCDSFSD